MVALEEGVKKPLPDGNRVVSRTGQIKLEPRLDTSIPESLHRERQLGVEVDVSQI